MPTPTPHSSSRAPRALFRRLLEVLAGSTRHDLRRQVQFLRAENQVLRSRLGARVRTTPQERARLVRLGKELGPAVRSLITIVSPRTFIKWVNQEHRGTYRRKRGCRKPGRPPTDQQIRELVLRLARETDWGVTRIHGELRKLGIRVSRTTVSNILKEAGIPTAPQRGEGTWDQFLRAHAKTLWACDFVAQRVLTAKGFVQAFVLIFIHVKSRRVFTTPATIAPDGAWTTAQAVAFVEAVKGSGYRPRILLRDRDSKFGPDFNTVLREAGVDALVLPPRSPNLNAFAERFIQTLRRECRDRFIVLGTSHLDHLVGEFTDYYNRQRPHSRITHCTPVGRGPPPVMPLVKSREISCQERLGGVIRHYHRRAA